MRSQANDDAPIPVSWCQCGCVPTHLFNPAGNVLVQLNKSLNVHDASLRAHTVVQHVNRADVLGKRVRVLEPHGWRQCRTHCDVPCAVCANVYGRTVEAENERVMSYHSMSRPPAKER